MKWFFSKPAKEKQKEEDLSLDTMEIWINKIAAEVHKGNAIWWTDIDTGERKDRNVGEMLMLIVSELAEAMEADRKNLNDDHLPNQKGFDVELADALIRLMDTAYGRGVNIGKMYRLKMEYNRTRPDHKRENRLLQHGKKY